MKLYIGGDISVSNKETAELFKKGDTKTLFTNVCERVKDADKFLINLECAITDSEHKIKKCGPNLKLPVGAGKVLKDLGVSDVCLSNNHSFDFGKEGMKDTFNELKRYGINYTGFGDNETLSRKNLVYEADGKKITVITVCEHEYTYALEDRMGARPYDPYDTNDDISDAKKNSDFVIVLYHGGKEHCQYPSPRLYKLCHSMVHHGADAVFCQHSHLIGTYENYNGAHILYGQGNFNFVYDGAGKDATEFWAREWAYGLLVSLNITDKIGIEFIPTVMEKNGIRLADEKEKQEILGDFNARNKHLLDGEWKSLWHKFCEETFKSDEFYAHIVPDDKVWVFSHFLDCEAHTDLWREMYKTWNHTNEKE